MSGFFESQHFHLETLADGVYAAVANRDEGGEFVNAGVVDLGGSVLAFDSFFLPQAARDLLAAADYLIGKPVSVLVNSHTHSDHIMGNYLFPAETMIISTHNNRKWIIEDAADDLEWQKEHLPETMADLQKQLDEAQDDTARRRTGARLALYRRLRETINDIVVRPPEVTFDKRLVLHGSQRTAELLTFGRGHTGSDIVLYLPDDRVIFAGDLILVSTHPFMLDSQPDRWLTVLDKVEKLDFEVLVPGHGPLGTRADIAAMRTYFAALERLVEKVIADGGTADDAANVPVPSDYVQWGGGAYPFNMRFLFERLSKNT